MMTSIYYMVVLNYTCMIVNISKFFSVLHSSFHYKYKTKTVNVTKYLFLFFKMYTLKSIIVVSHEKIVPHTFKMFFVYNYRVFIHNHNYLSADDFNILIVQMCSKLKVFICLQFLWSTSCFVHFIWIYKYTC